MPRANPLTNVTIFLKALLFVKKILNEKQALNPFLLRGSILCLSKNDASIFKTENWRAA
jgi:hypothetical protein